MARPVLRTQRIELRPMTVQHLLLLHRLDSNPEVMRYLGWRLQRQHWGRGLATEGAAAIERQVGT